MKGDKARVAELEELLHYQDEMIHRAKVALIRIGTFNPMSLPPTSATNNNLNLVKVVQKQKEHAANALYALEADPERAEALVKKYNISVVHDDWTKAPWERANFYG